MQSEGSPERGVLAYWVMRSRFAHAKDRSHDFQPCAAGKGILDFVYYLRCLKNIGFAGPLILHGLEENEVEFSRRVHLPKP